MKHYDVIVVGAGFSGIICAQELAKNHLSVLVIERKADIAKALHTTGILVDEACELIAIPPDLVRPISQARLYAPSMRFIEAQSDDYLFYATNTPALLQHLVKEACSHGVSFSFDTAFLNGIEQNKRLIINNGFASCDFLIGADGARSRVAAHFNLGKNEKFLIGVEAEYTGLEIENPDALYCFLNQIYAPGYIGWIVPAPNEILQIGLATHHDARPDHAAFVQKISPVFQAKKPNIIERRGGRIPIGGLVEPFYHKQIMLLGDAAGIVSPLTAGGIHTALYFGKRAGELLADYLNGSPTHPGEILMLEYPRFRLKMLMRRFFNHVPNWGFDMLISSPISPALVKMLFFLQKRLPARRKSRSVRSITRPMR